MSQLETIPEHPLTEQYIALVGGGMSSFDAGMALVGPLLPLGRLQHQLFDWEGDLSVDKRIAALVSERIQAAQTVRENTIERLISIVNQDIRRFFRMGGTTEHPKLEPVPVTSWSRSMASSVKKIKFTQKTDPFGNTTDTLNLEFHDPVTAMERLRDFAPELYEKLNLSDADASIDAITLEQLTDEELDALHAKFLKAV